jgi:hypothetical protein
MTTQELRNYGALVQRARAQLLEGVAEGLTPGPGAGGGGGGGSSSSSRLDAVVSGSSGSSGSISSSRASTASTASTASSRARSSSSSASRRRMQGGGVARDGSLVAVAERDAVAKAMAASLDDAPPHSRGAKRSKGVGGGGSGEGKGSGREASKEDEDLARAIASSLASGVPSVTEPF